MSLTRRNPHPIRLKLILLSALFASGLLNAGCARENPDAQNGETAVGAQAAAATTVTKATVLVDGRPVDQEVMISLYPCKGETPGNVLGVSEQQEVAKRVAGFVAKLRDPAPKARACAARQLGYLGPEAQEALPHLLKLVREEENADVRGNVSEALWGVGPGSGLDVDELLASIKSPDVEVRFYSAFALGYYRPHPAREKETAGALAAAAGDEDGGVRRMAVRGLARLGPAARDAVPALVDMLLDEKGELRHLAALALGNVGPEAEGAAPALLRVVYTTQDFMLYTSAAIALGRIGPAVLPQLAHDLKTDRVLRALDVLGHLNADGARPLVVEALRNKDRGVRRKAVNLIWVNGLGSESAVPLLVKELKGGDKDLRWEAAVALGATGRAAEAAVPDLTAALDDEDRLVRCHAAEALGKIGPAAALAVPELRRLMALPVEHEFAIPQRCAAKALIIMGPETKALVPAEMVKKVEEWEADLGGGVSDWRVDETRPRAKEGKERAAPPGW